MSTLSDNHSTEAEIRICLGCGYSLRGLGPEPRCPECGLLNIPDTLRREVWSLVDSGKWFFSSFFTPWNRRLPGWWWALDRDGDLRRAGVVAARNVAFALFIIIAAYVAADVWVLKETITVNWTDSGTPPRHVGTNVYWTHLGFCPFRHTNDSETEPVVNYRKAPVLPYKNKRTVARTWELRWRAHSFVHAITPSSWVVLLWAMPAMVGLWTQIRKGLPAYAKAPRTILAASCYETHRLIYVALVLAMLVAAETALRPQQLTVGFRMSQYYTAATYVAFAIFAGTFGALGWVGPVRSDYTNQLIRSRRHAIRVVLMYGLSFPGVMAGTIYIVLEPVL